MSTRGLFVVILCVYLSGCSTRAESISTQLVAFPEGGVVTAMTVVPDSTPRAVVSAGGHLYVRKEDRWSRLASQVGRCEDCQLAALFQTLLFLKPASVSRPAKLFASQNDGASWAEIPLPAEVKSSTAAARSDSAGSASIRATDVIRLFNVGGDAFLLHARHIWRIARNANGEFAWTAIDLSGLPFGVKRNSALPPVLRQFLPATKNRPFELVTVLSEQLLVFRRDIAESEWTLVSTLPTADLQLMGTPESDTVFLVTPDNVRRSDDGGESWFASWRSGSPRIVQAHTVSNRDEFDLLVAAEDGSVWWSKFGGSEWTQVVDVDPDARFVTQFAELENSILAATRGLGVFESKNGGASFTPRNQGLVAAIPIDVAQSRDDPVVVTPSGTYRYLESSGWSTQSTRSALAIRQFEERLYIGTTSGDILVVDDSTVPEPEVVNFGPAGSVRYGTDVAVSTPNSIIAFASDSTGARLVAWTRERGAAKLSESVWQPLEFDQRFLALLHDHEIEKFIVTKSGFQLIESSQDSVRLWRGDVAGTRWTEVNQFPKSAAVQLSSIDGPVDGLWLIMDGVLLWSEDGGESFEPVAGPWQAYTCLAIQLTEEGPALLVRTPRRLELYRLRNAGASPDYSYHPILKTSSFDSLAPNGMSVGRKTVVLVSPNAMLIGALPATNQGATVGASVALVVILGLLLAAIVFLFARRQDRRA